MAVWPLRPREEEILFQSSFEAAERWGGGDVSRSMSGECLSGNRVVLRGLTPTAILTVLLSN